MSVCVSSDYHTVSAGNTWGDTLTHTQSPRHHCVFLCVCFPLCTCVIEINLLNEFGGGVCLSSVDSHTHTRKHGFIHTHTHMHTHTHKHTHTHTCAHIDTRNTDVHTHF